MSGLFLFRLGLLKFYAVDFSMPLHAYKLFEIAVFFVLLAVMVKNHLGKGPNWQNALGILIGCNFCKINFVKSDLRN